MDKVSGGTFHGGAWEGIYPPGDPRWKGLGVNKRNLQTDRAEDSKTSLK